MSRSLADQATLAYSILYGIDKGNSPAMEIWGRFGSQLDRQRADTTNYSYFATSFSVRTIQLFLTHAENTDWDFAPEKNVLGDPNPQNAIPESQGDLVQVHRVVYPSTATSDPSSLLILCVCNGIHRTSRDILWLCRAVQYHWKKILDLVLTRSRRRKFLFSTERLFAWARALSEGHTAAYVPTSSVDTFVPSVPPRRWKHVYASLDFFIRYGIDRLPSRSKMRGISLGSGIEGAITARYFCPITNGGWSMISYPLPAEVKAVVLKFPIANAC